jgi:hypothetical protein
MVAQRLAIPSVSRANGKLGGQGSSEDLTFPFADNSGAKSQPNFSSPATSIGRQAFQKRSHLAQNARRRFSGLAI